MSTSGTSTPVLPQSAASFGGGSGSVAGASSSSTSSPLTVHLGVTRNRTLLFQSYRNSVPRPSRYGSGRPSLDASVFSDSNAKGKGKGKQPKRGGAYFDTNGRLATQGQGQDDDDQVDGEDEDRRLLLQATPSTTVDMSSLPPKWVDTSDEVDTILSNLRPRIAHLDRLHAKHVLPGFTDRSMEEREIQNLTTEITRDFRKCSKLISTLASSTSLQHRKGLITSRELSMAQNVQTALATKVQDASSVFRKKQANYMQRLRGLEIKHAEVSGMGLGVTNNGTSGAGAARSKEGEMALREDLELSRQQLASTSHSHSQTQLLLEEESAPPLALDEQIADRDTEIQRIAKSITELAELFQDLSSLVIDQGTMLDRIDFNIENMGRDMSEAVRELDKATSYQSRTSRGQCILFLLLCIALLIALLIVKPFWRSFFPPDSPAPSVAVPVSVPVSTDVAPRTLKEARAALLGF